MHALSISELRELALQLKNQLEYFLQVHGVVHPEATSAAATVLDEIDSLGSLVNE